MAVAMDWLNSELSCPVCLELFTPPVLVLPCSHNFCKRCIQQTLLDQNQVLETRRFCCPVCRKRIRLRGRGIDRLKRNILLESISEKFRQEKANAKVNEQNHQLQICEKHEELLNLMCLDDDIPICVICKVFGEHSLHNVVRLADVYEERKNSFTKEIKSMYVRSESAEGNSTKIQKIKNDLIMSAEETKAMIEAVGGSMLTMIKLKMSAIKKQVDVECAEKCTHLYATLDALQAPQRLYMQMKTVLEQHSNQVQFLREDSKLRAEASDMLKENIPEKVQEAVTISLGQYLEELLKNVQIYMECPAQATNFLMKISEVYNTWRYGYSEKDALSYTHLDNMIYSFLAREVCLFQSGYSSTEER
ncbi:tripartite motif-containing protein 54-like [Erpetoichthys calabaricus]|uniref:tripartite motif-containing protein 54-like n=1 Tax=Erpetoichthys calabaricus TaxID=27687 RepID=UPI0022345CF4|nr:tripartite motif-containing protein 54-like [Erpetoichthys calabaricus]